MKKRIALVIGLLTAASPIVWAGSVETKFVQTQPPERDWSFTLTPYAWMSSIQGTIGAGDRSADVDIPVNEVLKHLDMSMMVTAELRYKRWSFTGDLIYARLHDDIAPPAGLLFSSTHEVLKETIGTFEVGYRVVDAKTTLLDVFAGARVYNFYAQIRLNPNLGNQGVNNSGTQTWVDPIFGLRGRQYFSSAVFLDFYGDIGGFGAGSELSWQVLGGVGIQAAHWCDVELGYRALGFEYQPGKTNQDLITHGPILGAIIHF